MNFSTCKLRQNFQDNGVIDKSPKFTDETVRKKRKEGVEISLAEVAEKLDGEELANDLFENADRLLQKAVRRDL